MRQFNERYGRLVLVISCLLIWCLILLSFRINGYIETWYFWHFPAKLPPFLDFRLIPASAETFRAGGDPTVSNPTDPVGHIFNYPKVWYLIFYTGLTQADTIWICVLLIVSFFLVVFIFPEKLTVVESLLLLPVIFSSACMLLYERGNVDLAIFVVCGLVILLLDRFPVWALAVLMTAAIFKLFPFFGIGSFLKENKSGFFKFFGIGVLIFVAYLLFNVKDLDVARNVTQRGTFLSYGVHVIFDMLHAYFRYYLLKVVPEEMLPVLLSFLPHVSALLCLFIAFLFGIRDKKPFVLSSSRNIAAFRMGGLIYIGTFLFDSNWDYRLAFLIFTIPQIVRWELPPSQGHKWIVGGVFLSLLITCWYTFIRHHFSVFTDGAYDLQYDVFDEVMNWALFGGLAYLLTASAPFWFRSLKWNPFSKQEAV